MLQKCFQSIFIVGNIISICLLPLLIYLSKAKNKYNIKHTYKIFLIVSIILLIPILNIKMKSISNENYIRTNQIEQFPNINNSLIENIKNNNTFKEQEKLNNISVFIPKEIQIKSDNIFITKLYSSLPYIWISILSIMFIYYLAVYKLSIYKLKLKKAKNQEIEEVINSIKLKMKIKTNIDYAFSDNIIAPISIGIFKKKIIIPGQSFETKDYDYMLKHEIFHIKNKDIEYKFLLLILNCIYWFNPIIYFLINQINEMLELNCDYNILENESMEYRAGYGKFLLDLIEKNCNKQNKFVTNFASSRRSVMERFKNILNQNQNKRTLIISIILIVIIAISVLLVIFMPNVNIAVTDTKIANLKDANKVVSSQVENENLEKNEENLNLEEKVLNQVEEFEKIEFIEPLQGIIVARYGITSNIRKTTHTGLDIANSIGTSIKAAASGKVIYSDFDTSNGKMIIIDNGNSVKTYYSHCNELCVVEGQMVNQGDEIAKIGSTGNSTGPHLHFEIRINEEPVDPQLYVYKNN